MNKIILLSGLLIAIIAPACVPEKKPSVFKDAVQIWTFTDNNGIKVNGPVTTGIRMKGIDKESSLRRGGDGFAAHFEGGWLDAGQGKDGGLNLGGYAFTLHIRLRVPSGKWDAPIISKHGGRNKLAWQLYGRPFGSDSGLEEARLNPYLGGSFGGPSARDDGSERGWEAARQNYWSYGDQKGKGYALEFELGVQPEPLAYKEKIPNVANSIFRVGVPVSMIGAEQWHDVTVRFTGPKLELFVDGVLVDEEWPIGKLRITSAPCLIGAAQLEEQLTHGFQGDIAQVAVWNRAISDGDIVTLAGGVDSVANSEQGYLAPKSAPSSTGVLEDTTSGWVM